MVIVDTSKGVQHEAGSVFVTEENPVPEAQKHGDEVSSHRLWVENRVSGLGLCSSSWIIVLER